MPGTGLFHPGRQHSWQTAAALAAAGELSWYATAIYHDPARVPYSAAALLPGGLGARVRTMLQRRASPMIDVTRVRHIAAAEWGEMGFARLGWSRAAQIANRYGNQMFQRGIARLLQREPVERLWGYDTSSAWLFAQPQTQGMVRVLDQSAGHVGVVRDILLAERERYPAYFPAGLGVPSAAAVTEADSEIRSASHVIVGAQHAADALVARNVEAERVHVVPYGFDESRFPSMPIERPSMGTLPVRFLFVGAVGPRKGVHLLLEAFRHIPPQQARLRLVGPLTMPERMLHGHAGNVEYSPALPHHRIVEEYARAHCFVFPTLIDGGGVVLYEAAACGLGIVQSAMCGDGVRTGPLGGNGVVLQENTVDSLRAAIERIVANPGILRDWSAASQAMSGERTWAAYRRRIIDLLPRLI